MRIDRGANKYAGRGVVTHEMMAFALLGRQWSLRECVARNPRDSASIQLWIKDLGGDAAATKWLSRRMDQALIVKNEIDRALLRPNASRFVEHKMVGAVSGLPLPVKVLADVCDVSDRGTVVSDWKTGAAKSHVKDAASLMEMPVVALTAVLAPRYPFVYREIVLCTDRVMPVMQHVTVENEEHAHRLLDKQRLEINHLWEVGNAPNPEDVIAKVGEACTAFGGACPYSSQCSAWRNARLPQGRDFMSTNIWAGLTPPGWQPQAGVDAAQAAPQPAVAAPWQPQAVVNAQQAAPHPAVAASGQTQAVANVQQAAPQPAVAAPWQPQAVVDVQQAALQPAVAAPWQPQAVVDVQQAALQPAVAAPWQTPNPVPTTPSVPDHVPLEQHESYLAWLRTQGQQPTPPPVSVAPQPQPQANATQPAKTRKPKAAEPIILPSGADALEMGVRDLKRAHQNLVLSSASAPWFGAYQAASDAFAHGQLIEGASKAQILADLRLLLRMGSSAASSSAAPAAPPAAPAAPPAAPWSAAPPAPPAAPAAPWSAAPPAAPAAPLAPPAALWSAAPLAPPAAPAAPPAAPWSAAPPAAPAAPPAAPLSPAAPVASQDAATLQHLERMAEDVMRLMRGLGSGEFEFIIRRRS